MKDDILKIKCFIEHELSLFKFNKATKGFKYLKEAILICIINEDALDNLRSNVFPVIANKYKEKSPLNVKWCIEQIISTMYNNTEMNHICQYFNIERNVKPTLKQIIYTMVCKYNRLNELK